MPILDLLSAWLVQWLSGIEMLQMYILYQFTMRNEVIDSIITLQVGFTSVADEAGCIDACRGTPSCNWWSFDEPARFCLLSETCDSIETCNDGGCSFGEKNCEYDQIGITIVLSYQPAIPGLVTLFFRARITMPAFYHWRLCTRRLRYWSYRVGRSLWRWNTELSKTSRLTCPHLGWCEPENTSWKSSQLWRRWHKEAVL